MPYHRLLTVGDELLVLACEYEWANHVLGALSVGFFLGTSLLLGSWYGLLFVPIVIDGLVGRTPHRGARVTRRIARL